MADLAKAQLQELDSRFEHELDRSARLTVQFNPETLKVTYANQLVQPEGGGDQRGAPAQLFVGTGTTKLTCQLWFDVTTPQPAQEDQAGAVDDVRKLTNRVSYFISPRRQDKKFVPPAVRFLWGSFQFDGVMESVDESLEFFSPEGKPLRASVSIAMTQQKIVVFPPAATPGARSAGSTPTTLLPTDKALQQKVGPDWQEIAARNGIENPRRPRPGQRIR